MAKRKAGKKNNKGPIRPSHDESKDTAEVLDASVDAAGQPIWKRALSDMGLVFIVLFVTLHIFDGGRSLPFNFIYFAASFIFLCILWGLSVWLKAKGEPFAVWLGMIIVARTVHDGLTFPRDNIYFLAAIIILFAVWATSLILRGGKIRFPIPSILLAVFVLVTLLTAADTVQFDATYRSLLLWAGMLFLFILIANNLNSRLGVSILLGVFLVVSLVEAIWSILHLYYLLPGLREYVANRPETVQRQYGIPLTDEFIHRINVARAFGTFLFPNALAAFLVLSIPASLFGTIKAFREWTGIAPGKPETITPEQLEKRGSKRASELQLLYSVAIGIACFLVPAYTLFSLFEVAGVSIAKQKSFYISTVVIFPALLGVCSLLIVRFQGPVFFWWVLRSVFMPVLLVIASIALFLSYSRGGMLALAVSCIFTAFLAFSGKGKGKASGAFGALRKTAIGIVIGLVAIGIAATSLATFEATAQDPQQTQAPQKEVVVEGVKVRSADLMNVSTLLLRLSYWRVGMAMAMDNFWTGVGLDNFSTVYTKYKYPGAEPVKEAHNDYLQILCETGIFGLLAFCAFWGYFAYWGACRVWREKDSGERLVLAGLYGGVLAFLLHAVVDFNFANPGLTTFVIVLAACFYVRASDVKKTADKPEKQSLHQFTAFGLLICAALVAGGAARIFYPDYLIGEFRVFNLGDRNTMWQRLKGGSFLLDKVDPLTYNADDRPWINAHVAARMIPDREILNSFGVIGMANLETGVITPTPKDGPIPGGALLVVTDALRARMAGRKAAEDRIYYLEAIDSLYPHMPELAANIYQWYDLLRAQAVLDNDKERYTLACLKWAEESVERNSEQAGAHEILARALWNRGMLAEGKTSRDYFEKGIKEYELMASLYSSSADYQRIYGKALEEYAHAIILAGRKDEGEKLLKESAQVMKRAEQL